MCQQFELGKHCQSEGIALHPGQTLYIRKYPVGTPKDNWPLWNDFRRGTPPHRPCTSIPSAHQRIVGPFGMTFFLEEGYSGGDRPADPEEGLVEQ